MMKEKGYNGYAFVAEVDGRKMEFATYKEFKEYVEELDEESESSLYFRKNHNCYNRENQLPRLEEAKP